MILLIKNFLQSGVNFMIIFALSFYQGRIEKPLMRSRFCSKGRGSLPFFYRKTCNFGKWWKSLERLITIPSNISPKNKMKEQTNSLSLEENLKNQGFTLQISSPQMIKVKKQNLLKILLNSFILMDAPFSKKQKILMLFLAISHFLRRNWVKLISDY